MKVAIVSGCDANYYPLLVELIASIRQFSEADNCAICVLDAGLTAEQVEALREQAAEIEIPEWPKELSPDRVKGKDYLKACVCRPFIRDLFPGYDIYVWLDADTWVQDWSAIATFIEGAKAGDRIAVTNGADRAYSKPVRISWLGRWPAKVKNFYSANGKAPFGWAFAKRMVNEYVLSAGCFALHRDAPHWQRWQELVVQAAGKGKLFPAEQLALGHLVHIDGLKAELLPAYMHWLCVCPAMWDRERGAFVEPSQPHEVLGVLHLSGVDALRADRSATMQVQATDGTCIDLNLRFPGFDGGRVGVASPQRA